MGVEPNTTRFFLSLIGVVIIIIILEVDKLLGGDNDEEV